MQWVIDDRTCLVVATDEPYGVHYAARAVADDIQAALRLLRRPAVSDAGGAGLTIHVASGIGAGEPETFTIRTGERNGKPAVIIDGADERGAIYGLYHFAREYLGADPFKHLTQYRPPARSRIELPAVDYARPPHAFRYRGWHTECNVTRWPYDLGLECRYWKRLNETLLRCEGNMIKPDTNKPESMQVGLAQKMGLLITQEHCEPFGIGTWDFESDEPEFNFSFDDYPHVFLDAWEDSMRRYPDPSKVIWTLAFRGRNDSPFWEADPQRYDTDEKRGAYISRVLAAQQALVKKVYGAHDPAFIHNTWMEGNRLLQGGHTKLPADVHPVWSNNGYGCFRSMVAEGCPADLIRENLPESPEPGMHGVYYHVQVGDGCAPSLMQMVPPSRIEAELGKVYSRRMTAYLLVNVGQIATTLMPTAAAADFWRAPEGWSGEGFLRRWCERHFSGAAGEARQCYHDYFAAQVRYGQWGGWDDYVFGDMGYARMGARFVNMALSAAMRRSGEQMSRFATSRRFFENREMTFEQQMAHIEDLMGASQPKWDAARRRAAAVCDRLAGLSRRLFDTDVCVQMDMHRQWGRHVLEVIAAVRAYERSRDDWPAARERARAAQQCIQAVYDAAKRRDFGKWYEACDWQAHWRYACLPKAWEAAQQLIDAIDTELAGRSASYLSPYALPHTTWADTWSGPVAPYPFETGAVDRALPAGQHHQVFGRYKHEPPREE